jgi:hypothetical protein
VLCDCFKVSAFALGRDECEVGCYVIHIFRKARRP